MSHPNIRKEDSDGEVASRLSDHNVAAAILHGAKKIEHHAVEDKHREEHGVEAGKWEAVFDDGD
jgi:hypothetical protein